MEITYSRHGDYLLPDLLVPERENCSLGRYGLLRLEYLKQHRHALYTNLITTVKLNEHLADVNRQAREMVELITSQMARLRALRKRSRLQTKWRGSV